MRSLSTLLTFLLITRITASADNYLRQPDIRSTGLGGNEVTQSLTFNPSLLPLYERKRISLDYYNCFGVKELSTFSGLLMLPNPILPVGMHVASFGYEEYRQNLFRLLVSKRLHEYWTLGAAVQYASLQSILHEENPGMLSMDLGITWSPVDNLLAGLLIMNLPYVPLKDKDIVIKDFTGYKIQAGFEWLVLNSLFIFFTLEHNNDKQITGSVGIEYLVEDRFRIRAGMKATPFTPSFGVGYTFQSFTIDVAAVYHAVLGISSGIGITWSF
ncbi:MAG: hypothetical protein LUG98_00260 [Tannerellaceae bacterium]|nr:hypothetical protein [Tannerellaceae bacterium]